MMAGVKDLRFSEEVKKNPDGTNAKGPDGKDIVLSTGDLTGADRARAFESITSVWQYEARLPLNQMRGLDYDQVEEPTTKGVIKAILEAGVDRESRTITRAGNPAEFQQMLNTPLGRIGDEIVTYTPNFGKTVDRFELKRVGPSGDPDDANVEPAFELFFV